MDLYNIICPYCKASHYPENYEEGYTAMVCTECNRPFVNQTTMTPVFHSFAVVGFEPDLSPEYLPVPDNPNTVYRLDGDYVEVKYHKFGYTCKEDCYGSLSCTLFVPNDSEIPTHCPYELGKCKWERWAGPQVTQ